MNLKPVEEREEREGREEPPPFGKSWYLWYASVFVLLIFLMGLFYIFTKAYE